MHRDVSEVPSPAEWQVHRNFRLASGAVLPRNRRSEAKSQDLNRRSFGSGTERRPEAPLNPSSPERKAACLASTKRSLWLFQTPRTIGQFGDRLVYHCVQTWLGAHATTRLGRRPDDEAGWRDGTIFRFSVLRKNRIRAMLSR